MRKLPPFKNLTSRHTYHKRLDLPFHLLAHETVKTAEVIFEGISDSNELLSYSGFLVPQSDTRTTHDSHGMCTVQLEPLCGSDDRPSAGEFSVGAWQIKQAMLSEMQIHEHI